MGACPNAFGSGISILLKSKIPQECNEVARSALPYLSEGIHLLADHHYRLSLTRRAFTKPSLNIIGKNAAEAASTDDYLFGNNFAETLKAAQACERTSREVSKISSLAGRGILQPARQQISQRRIQVTASRPFASGNRRAPVRPQSAHQAGTPLFKSRPQRSQYRSRLHH